MRTRTQGPHSIRYKRKTLEKSSFDLFNLIHSKITHTALGVASEF